MTNSANPFDEHTRLWDDEIAAVECGQCGEAREITDHGTCFRCHIRSVSIKTSIEARKK